jgi:hypothetical protein
MSATYRRHGFVKTYPTEQARAAAERHHRWLTTHARPLVLPALIAAGDTSLEFTRVIGRHAHPNDVVRIAAHLGNAHGAAWASTLHAARMDQPHPCGPEGAIADFLGPRRAALHSRHRTGHLQSTGLGTLESILTAAVSEPVAFYKDTNPRNVLLTAHGHLVTVDVDDLTLAPFGYDLAKLIITLAMTHGRLPGGFIRRALDSYNTAAALHSTSLGHVDLWHLSRYATLHHILTAPYLGRNGYQHRWPAVQPDDWPGL